MDRPRGPALFTATGVVLIVVGARRRLACTRWDREDDHRLLRSDGSAASDEPRSQAPRSGGGWVIAVGAMLAFLGLLHILDLVATLRVSGAI